LTATDVPELPDTRIFTGPTKRKAPRIKGLS
jgi:hypothetical protein